MLPPIPIFEGIGDSLTAVQNGTSMQIELATLPYGSQYRQINLGIPGETVDGMLATYNSAGRQYAPNVTHSPFVVHAYGGNNDLPSDDAATLYADLLSLWAEIVPDTARLIVATITPATSLSGSENTVRLSVNAMITGDPTKYWRCIDLANKPTFIDPSNLLYYLPDGTHYTTLNKQIWAGFVEELLATI